MRNDTVPRDDIGSGEMCCVVKLLLTALMFTMTMHKKKLRLEIGSHGVESARDSCPWAGIQTPRVKLL